MAKRVKKRGSRTESKENRSQLFKVRWWFVDGCLGVLALMIYNFVLYVLTQSGVDGIISQMQDATGYFYLNSFIDFNFSYFNAIIGLFVVLALTFLLGMFVGRTVRKWRRRV